MIYHQLKTVFKLFLPLFFIACVCNISKAETSNVELFGKVRNVKNKKVIANATVSIPGTNIVTVTNDEGFFLLKIPYTKSSKGIKIEQIGYQTKFILPDELNQDKELIIYLEPSGKVLKEILVLGGDPKVIVEEAIKKIPENYSEKDNLFQGFYRETIQKGGRFINISEALIDVWKKPYFRRNSYGEKVGINKGRTLLSPNPNDTLSVKIMGGPYMPVVLDAVKNGDHLFTIEEINYFDFKMEQGVLIDDKMHYVISFKPNIALSYPLNSGRLFIDGDELRISRVEFELDMKDKGKVTRSILQKKPSGLNFKPLEVSGVVTYRNVNGKSYIHYIRSKIKFKCDWKKKLFSSTYTSLAEMVMVDRIESPDKKQKINDSFGSRKIFSDHVENYWSEDFWKDYNIIEPTESLEKAVEKLRKK